MAVLRPILDRIAYPSHMAMAPKKAAIANLTVHVGAFLFLDDIFDFDFGIYLFIASFAVIHMMMAWAYRKDPHVDNLWLMAVLPPDFSAAVHKRRLPFPRKGLELGKVDVLSGFLLAVWVLGAGPVYAAAGEKRCHDPRWYGGSPERVADCIGSSGPNPAHGSYTGFICSKDTKWEVGLSKDEAKALAATCRDNEKTAAGYRGNLRPILEQRLSMISDFAGTIVRSRQARDQGSRVTPLEGPVVDDEAAEELGVLLEKAFGVKSSQLRSLACLDAGTIGRGAWESPALGPLDVLPEEGWFDKARGLAKGLLNGGAGDGPEKRMSWKFSIGRSAAEGHFDPAYAGDVNPLGMVLDVFDAGGLCGAGSR